MHAVESVARRHKTPWQDCSIPFCLLFHLSFSSSLVYPHTRLLSMYHWALQSCFRGYGDASY